MSTKPLLDEIEEFLGREDVKTTETGFGIAAVNDGKFVGDLRRGRRVWPETAEKVRAYIREYRNGANRNDMQQARAS